MKKEILKTGSYTMYGKDVLNEMAFEEGSRCASWKHCHTLGFQPSWPLVLFNSTAGSVSALQRADRHVI